MFHRFQSHDIDAFFSLCDDFVRDKYMLEEANGLIHLFWNRKEVEIKLNVDGMKLMLKPNQLTTITFLHQLKISRNEAPLTAFSFNREFYCTMDHDSEVSCNGIIFFGAQEIPVISLSDIEIKKYNLLLNVFEDEFETRDNIQGEMLKMLLKRLIIKTTRLAKEQLITHELKTSQIDTIRSFNFLVDLNYKTKKQVSDYADMLFKSPKTLSNLFAKYNHKSPLQVIHERIVLEAKRYLINTDKTVKEIAIDLGFEDVSSFHKLFKKVSGQTPSDFKESKRSA